MKTALITGASAGLGAEFVRQLPDAFPEIEAVWLIARRTDKLEEVSSVLPQRMTVRLLSLDLCAEESIPALEALLREQQPEIALLVNNAGCGYHGNLGETDTNKLTRTVDLDIRALTAVTNVTLPYMASGSRIINISSIASFCPNPGMTVYSASKAYVSAFSRGLLEEVRPRGIRVTAVCPSPMRTEFLDIGGITGNSRMFEVLPYCVPEQVVRGAYRAAKAGRAVYTPKLFFKFYRVLAKLLPQAWMVKLAKT